MQASRISRHLLTIAATILVGGFLCATLVRLAPGFDVDEQQLDLRLNSDSVHALRAERAGNRDLLAFYGSYLRKAVHGDLGKSISLNQPVSQLLKERIPVTLKLVGYGLLLGWSCGLSLALAVALSRAASFGFVAGTLAGLCLCLPTAAVALLFIVINGPAFLAIALVVFPKVLTYSRNLLEQAYSRPHILMARAKGIGSVRILLWHVLPISGAQIFALAGVSLSVALGAAIPVEALCGIPGIGQLAWQAATGRDLALLVALTVVVTVVTLVGNTIADVAGHAFAGEPAA